MSISYEQAREQVVKIRQFYTHLTVYLLVNVGLLVVNLLDSPGTLWFYWPLLGWGIGVAAHAVSVFGAGRTRSREWEERQIKKIMDRGR